MPCLRGIEVLLTTKPDDEPIPEYPHPEGTSARILGTVTNRPNGQSGQRKAGPTVAVYIPSIPSTRFAINYTINNAPPAPCKYVFFRLYMNARPIAAWGVDPNVRSKGRVVKALWSAGGQYQDQIGFEGCNFVFLPGQEYKAVAEDGGLIEVQVFRAQERHARAPRLDEFRFQENYGFASPSIGLLDEPQDACFYDWHLLDAKDSPYASFRLHYRSLKNLKELNLIPSTELELLCAASPKALKLIAKMEAASKAQEDNDDDDGSEEQPSPSGNSDEAVFHDCREEPDASDGGDEDASHYFLKKPPELFPVTSSSLKVPQPSKALRDASRESYLQRPLPELPIEEPSRFSRRSSTGSAISSTMSITPSLLQYVDEESINPDEIEVGVAQLVELPPSESTLGIVPDEDPSPADQSISDYKTSPKSTGNSPLKGGLSPSRYLPMTGSGLERGIALFTSPKRSIFSSARQSLPSDFCSPRCLSRLGRTASNESDPVAGTPSPARTTASKSAARRESSPLIGIGNGKSLFGGLLKKNANESPSKSAGKLLDGDILKPADGGSIVKRTIGSWLRCFSSSLVSSSVRNDDMMGVRRYGS